MNINTPLRSLQESESFIGRHIGPDDHDTQAMLAELGYDSLSDLIRATVPDVIALNRPLALAAPSSEQEALDRLKTLALQNTLHRSLIGLGYYDTVTPPVILRNVLENPGWYTAYTPYQPEISQGRLETLLAYQQMVLDLTGMQLANASLLDEATAAAEAMALAKRVSKSKSNTFYIDEGTFPQTIDVIRTRADCFGFDIIVGPAADAANHDVFGAIFQYPDRNGVVIDLGDVIAALQAKNAITCVAADLMSLALLKSPGDMGADVVVGNTQRFGVPMGFGGPHAAYFATKDEYKRAVPGRIIGVSVDARGKQAFRMSLQTREQHIRREKANSNICTAQVLLANIAAMYAMYHGPEGVRKIALRIHRLTRILAAGLAQKGIKTNSAFFDTLTLPAAGAQRDAILQRASQHGFNLRTIEADTLGLSLDECSSVAEVETLWQILLGADASGLNVEAIDAALSDNAGIPAALQRQTAFMTHAVFNRYHNETDMLRYLKRLENRDLSLAHAMIPLGSCTMKLNATAEMLPVTWPEFSKPHPFVPREQVAGYLQMIRELEDMLAEICGFDAVSMQPNSGAQGEYAGLLAIRNYLNSIGQTQRNVCLIPSSAHGTNPASAQMLSMKVVVVACDDKGNIDVADLKVKVQQHKDNLAALMITYPSTHGVFEEAVKDICQLIHDNGGQVYMDGANLNAQVGVSRPGDIGADVSHVNLHKTFCIPHGGGGPGMGPIGIRKHLAPFVANHSVVALEGPNADSGAVSAAPWGSASILPISWMYISMMGASGLLKSTQVAILSANYIAQRLEGYYPVLYTGKNGRVAHECIIDLRPLKAASGITEEDVAKRLMDYGFHAPTMSFPVPGTLMIEPTESEPRAELDRFIEAMICIRNEIARVESGELHAENNMLKHAPHTLADIMDEGWDRPYSKNEAAFPVASLRDNKFWPSVNRIDNVYGDRNLFCACPAIESYT
ncbi:aminomethyl-transferring glycine dehydrogenase [Gammaproteobacteria bacterium LSUCC0112]|nr:aminomethyl-transferring glycine dehydrogenase [Gammaproteobacteria bacterium LSUCC0112]